MADPGFSLRRSEDGSNTLYDAASGECYHSHKGALTESQHVFVDAGQLHARLRQARDAGAPLSVLEMGFGTGLNYLLSARAALECGAALDYHALELNPLPGAALEQLGYAELLDCAALVVSIQMLLQRARRDGHGAHAIDTPAGRLTLHHGDALSTPLPAQQFSLCYFDAFSPGSAPALWRREQLAKFYAALRPGGQWLSYCARGAVRRDLQACGFAVERLPGPPGKREMLRATRPA